MATAITVPGRGARSRSGGDAGGKGSPPRSVREVCLLGGATGAASSWAVGDRVHWSGRAYRVAATTEAGYAHLAAE